MKGVVGYFKYIDSSWKCQIVIPIELSMSTVGSKTPEGIYSGDVFLKDLNSKEADYTLL